MKKQHLLITFLAIAAASLFSCGQETENSTETENTVEIAAIIPVVGNYVLDAKTSTAKWERTLDQKPTKQKVKLLGSMVDVELGAVKLNTNGDVTVTDGALSTTNDEIENSTIVFDMASIKFAKEKGDGLFDAKQYPNSTLELSNFTSDSTGYLAEGMLTIQKVSNPVTAHVDVVKTDQNYFLKGNFAINTLDFPLRDKVTKKDINKDEIKITFELNYSIQN